jgi:hypothetical protein
MDAKSRRKLEMGRSALAFCLAHPDASSGYTAAITRLNECMARATEFAGRQDEGQRTASAAVRRKQQIRETLRRTHLSHLARVGRVASRELPELGQSFVFRPGTTTYLAFRTAARGMAAEAQAHREVLVRHGLGEEVLENLVQALDQFDAVLEQGLEGRRKHVGARAELKTVADEVVQVVRVLDGLIRYRFMTDAEALAAWESASNVAGPFRPARPEESGEAQAA